MSQHRRPEGAVAPPRGDSARKVILLKGKPVPPPWGDPSKWPAELDRFRYTLTHQPNGKG